LKIVVEKNFFLLVAYWLLLIGDCGFLLYDLAGC